MATTHATTISSNHRSWIPETLLGRALMGNSFFSEISGFVFILFAPQISRVMGITDANVLGNITGVPFLYGIGGALIVFALMLFWLSRRPNIPVGEAIAVIIADLTWIALSAWVVFGGVWPLTTTGSIIVIALADVVAVFVVAQGWGLRRALRS